MQTVRDIAKLPIAQWPAAVRVEPVRGAFDIEVRPPGSKSLTNRALLLAALAEGVSTLTGALVDADDAQVMIAALRKLGAEIEITPEVDDRGESCGNATLRVRGVGGRWKIKAGEVVTLDLHNAGTATRFLTAAAILQPQQSGGIIIDGNARMRQRPIGELVDALNGLTDRGARVRYVGDEGFPPVLVPTIESEWISAMRQCFAPARSGQFVSAMMLLAPFLPHGLEAFFTGAPTSMSYVAMTLRVLEQVGVRVHGRPPGDVRIEPSRVSGFDMKIEPDASGSTYFVCAARLVPGSKVLIADLRTDAPDPLQADARFGSMMPKPDVCRAVDADLSDLPDAAMTAAVLAAFAPAPSTLTGLRTLRVKETDRIQALVNELGKIGVRVEPFGYTNDNGQADEGIRITPPRGGIDCSPGVPLVEFETYDDHRMAMSLALIGLRRPNVVIKDPACVRKTYPTFWRDLAKVYG
jgi:3-phosphoshikimate 1-carboxyvinyltransferase